MRKSMTEFEKRHRKETLLKFYAAENIIIEKGWTRPKACGVVKISLRLFNHMLNERKMIEHYDNLLATRAKEK